MANKTQKRKGGKKMNTRRNRRSMKGGFWPFSTSPETTTSTESTEQSWFSKLFSSNKPADESVPASAPAPAPAPASDVQLNGGKKSKKSKK